MATEIRPTVQRIRELGGGGLPESALQVVEAFDAKRQALIDDRKLSESYKREQFAVLDRDADVALSAAEEAEIAAAVKAFDAREGAVLAQVRGTVTSDRSGAETSIEQTERHHRRTLEATMLLSDQLQLQSSSDPEELTDFFDELLESGKTERIRRLGSIAVSRLGFLKEQKTPGAAEAHTTAWAKFQEFRKRNPSPSAQLKAVRQERAIAGGPIRARHQRTREIFQVGQAR